MLHIEKMRIQLPAGFEHRASRIARLVGESMAEIESTERLVLDRLTVGPIQTSPNATDQEIAQSITNQISSMLGRGL